MIEDVFDGSGEGAELALSGDTIRKRHIATRASLRRKIIVLVVGDAEFEGYSIGIDGHSLQILELPSGEVSSVALEYIVAISDGKSFSELTRDEKDIVDRRTSSFRKTCQTWLVSNWPNTYDRREDDDGHFQNRHRSIRPRFAAKYGQVTEVQPETEGGLNTHADSEVRNGASGDGSQGRGQ